MTMKDISLEARRGITPRVSFPVITVASDYLAGAYIDVAHAELDAMQVELSSIRRAALEKSRGTWSDIDAAQMLVSLIGTVDTMFEQLAEAIGGAKDTTDKDGVVTEAIDVVRALSEFGAIKSRSWEPYASIRNDALPLAGVMAESGTAHRLVKIQRDQTFAKVREMLWRAAALCEIKAESDDELYRYFDAPAGDHPWPPLKGRAQDKHLAISRRIESLEALSQADSRKLVKACAKHVEQAASLMEKEEKN